MEESKLNRLQQAPDSVALEELVEIYDNLRYDEEELKATRSVVSSELLRRLKDQKRDGVVVNDHAVSKRTKVSFGDTPFEYAQEMGCTTTKKDDAKLKVLWNKGVEVPGVKVTEFIDVRDVEKEDK